MTKNESGMSEFLKAVNKQAGTISNMELLDQLASVLDKHREVGIQEAIYRALSLPMTKSSIKVKYISTVHPNFRDGLLKADLEDLAENESIFHFSSSDYYSNRELKCIDGIHYEEDEKMEDYWENLTQSEFISNYDIVYRKKSVGNTSELDSNDAKDFDQDQTFSGLDAKTMKKDHSKYIPLKNGIGYIKRRTESCILRYYLNFENDEDLKRGLLILFFPFTNEMKDIHEQDIHQLYKENETWIKEKREIFEKHKVMTDIIDSIELQAKTDNENDLEESVEDDFIDEESTSTEDLEKFEKWAKEQAKKSLAQFKDLTSILQVQEIRNLVMTLNIQQRMIFDDFCERLNEEDNPPFYLYIAGEAGTGKSFLVKIMIEAIKHLRLVPGVDLKKPSALVMAPTANAAYIINGKTIESALGMLPNKTNSFSKRKSNQVTNLSFLYENVAVLFCDEISMVGSAKFTKMNFQMQDVTGSNEFMGGLPFVAVGDFRQLPPVRDQFIFEKNHLDGRPSIAPSHWDDNFHIYYLTEKMRNQKDPEFSRLTDRVGDGTYTQADINYLRNCVRETDSENENENFKTGRVSIIVMTNKVRQEINEHKLETLIIGEESYISLAIDRCTNLENAPEVPTNLSLTQTGGLEGRLILKRDAPIIITSNHPKVKYKEDGIMNGAKGYVDSVQVSKNDPDKIEVVWIVFKDKNIGKFVRYDLRNLSKLHKPFNQLAVPILKQKKTFSIQNGEIRYQRCQFPLTLSYATTAYKCQGDTLDEVIIDFEHTPQEIKSVPCGSFYVALTRVKEGRNVYLKSFEENYITVNKRVEEKIKAMRMYKAYNFKKIYLFDQIFENNTDDLKFGYFNINGLMRSNHAEYLDSDLNLLHLDCLVVSETWLDNEVSDQEITKRLKNWKIIKRLDATDKMKHMGLILLTPTPNQNINDYIYNVDYIEGCTSNTNNLLYQGLVIDIKHLYSRFVFLYVRQTPTNEEIKNLKQALRKCDGIIGDLNINPTIPEQRNKLLTLCGTTKYMALEEITTRSGSQLEHVLLEKELKSRSFATSYFNFASDHKCIALRIACFSNSFTDNFKKKIHFNQDLHNKKVSQKDCYVSIKNTNKENKKEARTKRKQRIKKHTDSVNQPSEITFEEDENCNLLKILRFSNPIRENLCFSNSITTLILNIPTFSSILQQNDDQTCIHLDENDIFKELYHINMYQNFTVTSSDELRSTVHNCCRNSGQISRTFEDKNQHDAGEYLTSIFEHMFNNLAPSFNIDEQIFGGIIQEALVCRCGHIKQLPMEKLPEILTVGINGLNIQECVNNYLKYEEIEANCDICQNKTLIKKTEMISEPSTLIIQLKRFAYVQELGKTIKRREKIKVTKNIRIPDGSTYTISTIVHHYGEKADEGHYNILVYNASNDTFILVDDLHLNLDVEITEDLESSSYIFVYIKNEI